MKIEGQIRKWTERKRGRSWSDSRWILDWSQQALLLSRPPLFLPVGFTLKASLWSGQREKDQPVTCFCRGSFSPARPLYPSPSPSAFCPSWAFLPQIKGGQHLGLFIMPTERHTILIPWHTHTHIHTVFSRSGARPDWLVIVDGDWQCFSMLTLWMKPVNR